MVTFNDIVDGSEYCLIQSSISPDMRLCEILPYLMSANDKVTCDSEEFSDIYQKAWEMAKNIKALYSILDEHYYDFIHAYYLVTDFGFTITD